MKPETERIRKMLDQISLIFYSREAKLDNDEYNQLYSLLKTALSDERKRIAAAVTKKVHMDVHISLNWGMQSKEEVVHLEDILALLHGDATEGVE